MEMVKLTHENLEQEHICCAISGSKDPQVLSKKAWLSDRLDEGLVFLKSVQRVKCFIEYIPVEYAWVPIDADGFMHINCFWVSGSLKGHGYGCELLEACVEDAKAKGKKGLTVISSPKKMAFLSDPKFLSKRGFQVADAAEPYFTLLYLPFSEDVTVPKFKEHVKNPHISDEGYVLYYTAGCPFTAKYVPLIEECAAKEGIPFKSIKIDSREKAQAAPAAWTNYALFYNREYVTNEILSEKKFCAMIEKNREQG